MSEYGWRRFAVVGVAMNVVSIFNGVRTGHWLWIAMGLAGAILCSIAWRGSNRRIAEYTPSVDVVTRGEG